MGRTKDKVVEDCRNRNQSAYKKAMKRGRKRERERGRTKGCRRMRVNRHVAGKRNRNVTMQKGKCWKIAGKTKKISTAKKTHKKGRGGGRGTYQQAPLDLVGTACCNKLSRQKKDLKKDFFLWDCVACGLASCLARMCRRLRSRAPTGNSVQMQPVKLAPPEPSPPLQFNLSPFSSSFSSFVASVLWAPWLAHGIQAAWQPFKSEVSFRFLHATPPTLALSQWLLSLSTDTHTSPFYLATLFCILKISFSLFLVLVSRVMHTPFCTH